MIPNGLNLHFSLAYRPTDNHLLVSIQSILNTASSRILDVIHEDVCKSVDSASCNFSDIREETNRKNDMHITDYYVGLIRQECNKELEDLSRKHEKKLSKLTPFAAAISNQSIQTAESRFSGSLKITTNRYTTDRLPVMKNHQVRSHRRLNRKVKRKRLRTVTSPNGKYDYVPTQEDVRKLDPIVLTDRIRLNQDQTSICRLPDCFAPTP